MDDASDFEGELDAVLPPEIPQRERLIAKGGLHLRLIADVNEYMNLTRIATPREAAVKHVLDSVLPWRYFQQAATVLDAGTGAGFPGIPLALALPETRFVLAESVGKKARFVERAVETLELPNVEVIPERAELLAVARRLPVITARAVGPLEKLLELFRKPLQAGSQLLLYKGPDAAAEFARLESGNVSSEVLSQYELPFGFGSRTFIRVARAAPRKPTRASPQ